MSSLRPENRTEKVDYLHASREARERAYSRGSLPPDPPTVTEYPYPIRWLQTSIRMGGYRYAIAYALVAESKVPAVGYSFWVTIGYALCITRGRYRSEFFGSSLIDSGGSVVQFPVSQHRCTAKWWVENAYMNLMVDKIDKALQSQKESNDGSPT